MVFSPDKGMTSALTTQRCGTEWAPHVVKENHEGREVTGCCEWGQHEGRVWGALEAAVTVRAACPAEGQQDWVRRGAAECVIYSSHSHGSSLGKEGLRQSSYKWNLVGKGRQAEGEDRMHGWTVWRLLRGTV